MRLTVINRWKPSIIEVPVAQMISGVASNYGLGGAVESFCLPIGLGMIGRREQILNVQYLVGTLKA